MYPSVLRLYLQPSLKCHLELLQLQEFLFEALHLAQFQLLRHFDVQFLFLKFFNFFVIFLDKKSRIFLVKKLSISVSKSRKSDFHLTYVRRAEWGSEYRLFKNVFPGDFVGVVPFWLNRPLSTCDDVIDFRVTKSLFPNAGTKSATLAPRFLINTWAIPAELGSSDCFPWLRHI